MFHLFHKKPLDEKPPYLDRIDELAFLDIVRLKGRMDQTMIPLVEARIQENRRHGSKIDKNVLLDFSKVDHVDTATIAFHMMHLKEYKDKGFMVGYINIPKDFQSLLDIFRENGIFKIFPTEEEAVKQLNTLPKS